MSRSYWLLLLLFFAFRSGAQSVQRNSLIEDFSNAECHPCKTTGESLHPAIVSLDANDPAAHLNIIAYQLNFPGYDASYNIHALQRSQFYQITGIPALKLNGKAINPMFTEQQFHEAFDTSRNTPSPMTITGSYMIREAEQQVAANFSITPHMPMEGPYKVYAAIVERHYTNTASSIGMTEYYFVMRRMLPDSYGQEALTWTANTARDFHYTASYEIGNPPVAGSFDFWGNPLLSDLIVFVQDTVSREIVQSQLIRPSGITQLEKYPGSISPVLLYPVPARDRIGIAFGLTQSKKIRVVITDLFGRKLQEKHTPPLPAGRNQVTLNLSTLPAGIYRMQLIADDFAVVRPFTISP